MKWLKCVNICLMPRANLTQLEGKSQVVHDLWRNTYTPMLCHELAQLNCREVSGIHMILCCATHRPSTAEGKVTWISDLTGVQIYTGAMTHIHKAQQINQFRPYHRIHVHLHLTIHRLDRVEGNGFMVESYIWFDHVAPPVFGFACSGTEHHSEIQL